MGNWHEEAVRRLRDAKLLDPDHYFEGEENKISWSRIERFRLVNLLNYYTIDFCSTALRWVLQLQAHPQRSWLQSPPSIVFNLVICLCTGGKPICIAQYCFICICSFPSLQGTLVFSCALWLCRYACGMKNSPNFDNEFDAISFLIFYENTSQNMRTWSLLILCHCHNFTSYYILEHWKILPL